MGLYFPQPLKFTWVEVPGAVDYRILTDSQLRLMAYEVNRVRALRKLHHKRKAQRRARTGRRRK